VSDASQILSSKLNINFRLKAYIFTYIVVVLKVMLCTLLFQTMAGYEWSTEARRTVEGAIEKTSLWSNYRIARSAAR
jgi:hypothetical protein